MKNSETYAKKAENNFVNNHAKKGKITKEKKMKKRHIEKKNNKSSPF